MAAAIKMRSDKNINGSANGSPNLAPTKPVLHKRTKRNGATRTVLCLAHQLKAN